MGLINQPQMVFHRALCTSMLVFFALGCTEPLLHDFDPVAEPVDFIGSSICGDGMVSGDEICDDGNHLNTDGCPDGEKGTCVPAICGDGFIQLGVETCDDGNKVKTDSCPDGPGGTCHPARCGDGFEADPDEECDDGNNIVTDECPDGPGGTCEVARCGDGFILADVEECDDGNGNDSDGCPDGVEGSCKAARCGDGVVKSDTEICDDGNESNTDGCLATCIPASCGDGFVEDGEESCDAAGESSACDIDCTLVECGDGLLNATALETCDDGNSVNTDACPDGADGTCLAATCGDGFIQTNVDSCDDGANNSNTIADACRTNCVEAYCGDSIIDAGEGCDGGGASPACTVNCSVSFCGDEVVNVAAGEECEDGNTVDNDSCSNECLSRTPQCGNQISDVGEDCDEGGETAFCDSDCTYRMCGDGQVNSSASEACDDGNSLNTDNCLSTCVFPSCGDDFIWAGHEVCDDGNIISEGEGSCVADCSIVQICGNGTKEGTEVCDDGDSIESNDCLSTCLLPACGDGFIWTGHESCDDNNTTSEGEGYCVSDCSGTQLCGDGITSGTEPCDDGNLVETDDCLNSCSGATCGDGHHWSGNEICDDAGESMTCDVDCSAVVCGDGVINGSAGEFCDDGIHNGGTGYCATDCLAPVGMVVVPSGHFMMGCNTAVDSECGPDESPYHEVYLDTYFIDKYEVTASAYEECVDAGGCVYNTAPTWNLVYETYQVSGKEQHPINFVSWFDAKAYCEWKNKRLPTEAEWEKAARGTDGQKYPWGNSAATCSRAVIDGCSTGTRSVGSLTAGVSPYGAMDMMGNVREWVADWFGETYYSVSPPNNPTGPTSGGYRVTRGGAFTNPASFARASVRINDYDTEVERFHGIRCAK